MDGLQVIRNRRSVATSSLRDRTPGAPGAGAGQAPSARWKEPLADDSSGSYAANKHVAMSLHEAKSDNVTAQEFARG